MQFHNTHCPSCGNAYKKTTPKWIVIVAILVALTVGVIIGMPKSTTSSPQKSAQIKEIEQQTQSKIALQGYLKDPVTAQIRNHKGYCGEVNSKNSFGAYTGFKRFIATPSLIFVENDNIKSDEFQKTWMAVCS